MYFSKVREYVRNNLKDLLKNNIMLNKLIKSSDRQMEKAIRLIFLSLSISGVVQAERNTIYTCEIEYKICWPYMIQTVFCK